MAEMLNFCTISGLKDTEGTLSVLQTTYSMEVKDSIGRIRTLKKFS